MNLIGLDGQSVIILGGTATPNNDPIPEDSIYVLNITNFEWSIPKISGQIPKSRVFHRADVIGKYMVVSFGKYIGILWYYLEYYLFNYNLNKILNFNRKRLRSI